MLQNFIKFVTDRAKEKSTYAGIFTILVSLGVSLDSVLWENITQVLLAVAGLVAFVVKEQKSE